MDTCHILLIDDHVILLQGLHMLLEGRIAGARIHDALSLLDALQCNATPDVISLDLKLPGMNGLDGLVPLKQKWPQAKIVVLSAQDDAESRRQALLRGADAFVSKATDGSVFVETVKNLIQGVRPPSMSMSMAGAAGKSSCLSPRQCEVLDLLCCGLTNKLIARTLHLSDNTVRRHVQDIFAVLEVASRTEAVFEARRRGIVP